MEEKVEEFQSGKNKIILLILKLIALSAVMYLFFFSLELMGVAFKLLGKDTAEKLLSMTSNPFAGLFIGILTTSIIQSSSTTTSMVVGMVGSGILPFHNAIPIIMGANIGTTITNTIVSLGSINNNIEFRRAFAASIVHDFFNLITVAWLFPLQYYTNFLEKIAVFLATHFSTVGGVNLLSPVKIITKPLAHWTMELIGNNGLIGAALSLVFLFLALRYLVKLLKMILVGKLESWFRRTLFRNATHAFVVGIVLTIAVQSSSITTSFIVPIVGAGILTLEQVFPFTLGANIGTTITALLAAMVIGNTHALIVAFSHLSFNILGTVAILKIQFIPITMARKFSALVIERKWLAFVYILFTFFILPISLITIVR